MSEKIVIATENPGKYREIVKILRKQISKKYKITSLKSLKKRPRIKENGKTYLKNALKKAKKIAELTGNLAIADDSGLEVDYLKGRPGIRSARFSGKNSTYKRNNSKLAKLLEGLPRKRRKAKFVCTSVAYFPHTKRHIHAEGEVRGYIGHEEKGSFGFGYDPLFYYPPFKKTFAEIPTKAKNKISHRARAFTKLAKKIKPYL